MMMASEPNSTPFAHLSDDARLWIFGVDRPLAPQEEDRLLAAADRFLDGWKAHGHPLAAARDWRLGRFLMIAVDERVTPPSGCSIDALVRTLRQLESELGVEMVGGGPVWYRDPVAGDTVHRVSRDDFRAAAREGAIDSDTVVFDLALTRVGQLRARGWERRASESWHARLLA